MGFLDKVMGRAKETAQEVAHQAGDLASQARETAGELADKHGDKITGAVDKATDFVDQKTGGKLAGVTEKIDQGAEKAVGALKSDDGTEVAADATAEGEAPAAAAEGEEPTAQA